MIFVIGYSDGHELSGTEAVEGADAVLQAEQRCQEATGGNFGVVLINPSMVSKNGRWFARYEGTEKALHCDYTRKPSWSADGKHWESCYHAIERLFNDS